MVLRVNLMSQVIRHYHGHLSAVYCLSLHPTIDVLLTGGRDSSARVCMCSVCILHAKMVTKVAQFHRNNVCFCRFCSGLGHAE